jgi:hypothetical protein
MAIENDSPGYDPSLEGFNSETNIFRPNRNYIIEPLSQFEVNNFLNRHPETSLPSLESMLNRSESVDLSLKYTPEPVKKLNLLTPVLAKPFELHRTSIFSSSEDEEDESAKEGKGESSALGEVAEGLASIFNPFKWFK